LGLVLSSHKDSSHYWGLREEFDLMNRRDFLSSTASSAGALLLLALDDGAGPGCLTSFEDSFQGIEITIPAGDKKLVIPLHPLKIAKDKFR
jgi:hypothetical protein